MIIERATLFIHPGSEDDFEAGFPKGRAAITQAEGIGNVTLARGIESPGTYLLIVEWESVEHHTAFRESERFGEWRGAIGGFFAKPPEVEHFDPVS